ncbi:5-formyltetrahydrofolate cyclo-ligase [Actinomyces sp. B33]|uniref:5-formyltetrahydrofolate cyclo-ligase n=1 Tax=Actinomyces sp. B33 TaxID=2942131 RepID=UPI0023418C9D|nr:5-formyltetrahydrofolate cyclo-ligase [Actinomyces sp. B33]MDC4232175.1 5-formyltetrahydrofolate cyclo-ligase [Actinomyces sp. B33]
MGGGKAGIREGIRLSRAARRGGGGADAAEALGLVESWREALALLGVDGARPALFVPTRTEPDVRAVIGLYEECLLPILADGGRRLDGPAWGVHRRGGALVRAAGAAARQPSSPILGPEALGGADAVLVAALGVDASGTRIGQGGGWYDRALVHRRPGAPVIAAVFDDEVLGEGELPSCAHDIRVDAAITPTRALLLDR